MGNYKPGWRLKEEVNETIRSSIAKNNKAQTIINKINIIFKDYDGLILNSNSFKGIYKDEFERLKNKAKALEMLKSGFFRADKYHLVINLSDIKGYRLVGGEEDIKCVVNCSEKEHTVDKIDYEILKIIFE